MRTGVILMRERKMAMLSLKVYCFIFFSQEVCQHNWQTLANAIDWRNRNLLLLYTGLQKGGIWLLLS